MNSRAGIDDRLVRALSEGGAALPDDHGRLAGYARVVLGLLAEKALEREPSWELALESAVETEALLTLEAAIVEKAVAIPCATLEAVLGKFAVWKALCEGADQMSCERLICSIEADVARIARTGMGGVPEIARAAPLGVQA